MKIDSEGTVVFENEAFPEYLGDSCAETGRLVVLTGDNSKVDLWSFVTANGFVRHPDAPEIDAAGNSWRESDFTADQFLYLMMAADLCYTPLFDLCVARFEYVPLKAMSVGVRLLGKRAYTAMALAEMVQIQILNRVPWRWSDDGRVTSWWKFVKRENSSVLPDSTVEYMCSFIMVIFLHRKGIKWPSKMINRDRYLAKTRQYYADKFNSAWFTQLFEEYKFT